MIDTEKLQSGIVEVHAEAANVPGDFNADENMPPNNTAGEDQAEEKVAENSEEVVGEPEGPHDMTVEEYMAKCAGERQRLQGVANVVQKKGKKKQPILAEGKDALFKGMVAYVKKSTQEDEDSEEEGSDEGDENEDALKRKRTLEVPFLQNRNSGNNRGFRGGRGRGRGSGDFRGGRGREGRGGSSGGQPGRTDHVQLQLNSDIDFPQL